MNSAFIVRDFIAADYEQVLAVWAETGLNSPERADTLEVIHETIAKGGTLFVLEHKQKNIIVGTSWITNDGRRLYLHHFGIKKEYQQQKLSLFLINTSLTFAQKMGLQIKLEVHNLNKIALHLYEKVGFNYLRDFQVMILRNTKNIKPL